MDGRLRGTGQRDGREGSITGGQRKTDRPPAAERRAREDTGGIRDALLAAATAEFARNGFAGARIGSICKQAGTTVRMVYHYFGSKSGLYIAVLEQAMGSSVPRN